MPITTTRMRLNEFAHGVVGWLLYAMETGN
jgi:hypothetical protein